MGDLSAGTTVGQYELLVEIGRGGMASVWVALERARGGNPERLVAVKIMLPELARDLEFRGMFLDEGRLAMSIDHPNVVKVFEVSEHAGVLFMAMEWIVGDSLRAVIRAAGKRRPIPSEIAVRVIADAAAGLHAAHELRGWDGRLRELVHCDVSPHNVLIGLDGAVRITDFGVASALGHVTELQGDNIRGKYGYMSPEQADGKAVDRRSDLFSLGTVLYEVTTGTRLFKGRDRDHTLDLVVAGEIPKPSALEPEYPKALESIVMKALRRDVDRRYQTADEMRRALERFLVDQRVAVPRAGVAGLLKRVLRQRLAELREAVRSKLHRREPDGSDPTSALVPAAPVESLAETGSHPSTDSLTGSYSELPVVPRIAHTAIPTSEPSASKPSGPTTSSTSQRAHGKPRTSRAVVAIAWAIGVLCGASATLVAQRFHRGRVAPGDLAAYRPPPEGTGRRRSTEAPPAASGERDAESIEDLPVVDVDAGAVAAARRVEERRDRSRARKRVREEIVSLDQEPARKPEREGEEPRVPPDRRPPLNRSAAIVALGSAARSASGCRQSDGPSGAGRATVTFAPDGRVSAVSIGHKFAGTRAGSCVSAAFRHAHIPAFSGSPVTLSYGFRIAK